MSFSPRNELEALIYAGHGDAVLEMLAAMPEPQRFALAGRLDDVADLMRYWWYDREVVHETWGMRATDGQRDAIGVAMLVCAPADRAARFRLQAERLVAVAKRFRPPSLPSLARELWGHSHPTAALQLAQAGLSPFDLDEDGILRLMALPQRTPVQLRDYLSANIETLKPVLLRIFEIEGTGDNNLAAIEKYTFKQEQTWTWNLLRLSEDGVYSRAELLAATLSTLERDWPQFRAGWFSRFHDALAPTPEEMAPHAGRYPGLLQSRIPPTVTLALKACAKLSDAKALAGADLLDALPAVMLSAVKAQINAALKMLDGAVKRDASSAHAAARVAIAGLQHTDPDVQLAILARLGKWRMDDDSHAALLGMAPYIAASVRPALEALVQAAPELAGEDGPPWRDIALPARAQPLSPIDPSRALPAVATLDDLIAICARLLEDESDLDLFEMAVGALLAARPLPDDARERFAPVLKRARKLKVDRWDLKACLSSEFARLLLAVVANESRDGLHAGSGILAILAERIDDANGFDVATHRGGFIDPAVLVQRARTLGERLPQLPLRVQVRALLRLAPGSDAATLSAAMSLPQTPFSQALCYALGGDWPTQPEQALCLAAARIRSPGADDPQAMLVFGGDLPDGAAAAHCELRSELVKWEKGEYTTPRCTVLPVPQSVDSILLAPYRHGSFWRHAEALILFGASLFPSSHEAMYADALPGLANNLQYGEAEWHHGAWIRVLGEPTTGMTPSAITTLALALMSKDPGRLARAIDAFVASSIDGRLDIEALGQAFLGLIQQDYFMAGRLGGSLATAAAAHPDMPAVVIALVGAICELPSGEAPRDFARLLQLMQELVLQHRLRPGVGAMAALKRLKLGGKAKAVQGTLLETVML